MRRSPGHVTTHFSGDSAHLLIGTQRNANKSSMLETSLNLRSLKCYKDGHYWGDSRRLGIKDYFSALMDTSVNIHILLNSMMNSLRKETRISMKSSQKGLPRSLCN